MVSRNEDGPHLQVRCPSCGRKFQAGADLRGRTVECGGCEHQFVIDETVISRVKKFYPGEKHDPSLHRFHRVPLPTAAGMPDVMTVAYGSKPDPAHIEPVSPLRIIAGFAAVAGMILVGILLIFGAERGGFLDGVPLVNRLVMAGFAATLGVVLLVYANPRGRLKAGLGGGALGAALLAVPFFFDGGVQPLAVAPDLAERVVEPEPPPMDPEEERIAKLREKIGMAPLERELARLEERGGGGTVMGLFLTNLTDSNMLHVRDYIIRVAGADRSTHPFPRERGQFLLVVTGLTKSLEEMEAIVSRLGSVEASHPELGVIEVRVDRNHFTESPAEKLSNKEDPSFYALNKRELESIILDRCERAVARLAGAEPTIFRADITRRLIELLGQKEIDFKENICRALMVWAEEDGPASDAAMVVVRQLHEEKRVVPLAMMALIVKERNPDVLPILDELWFKDSTRWEGHYSDFGSGAEQVLLKRFPETVGMVRHSAVKILGRIGGRASLPVLAEARHGANPELAVLVEQAEKAIRERLGN